jgi:hypothetical protein
LLVSNTNKHHKRPRVRGRPRTSEFYIRVMFSRSSQSNEMTIHTPWISISVLRSFCRSLCSLSRLSFSRLSFSRSRRFSRSGRSKRRSRTSRQRRKCLLELPIRWKPLRLPKVRYVPGLGSTLVVARVDFSTHTQTHSTKLTHTHSGRKAVLPPALCHGP